MPASYLGFVQRALAMDPPPELVAAIVHVGPHDFSRVAVRVSLSGAGHRFGPGHRLRLQVPGGAHPRFARNPGNGQVDAAAEDLVPTQYDIGLTQESTSVLLLPVAG